MTRTTFLVVGNRDPMKIKITCAVCDKPVERVECMTRLHLASFRFRVYCHGAIDVCEVDRSFIEANGPNCLEAGRAFVTPLIAAAESR
jgi:hypothetical protein